MLIVFLPEKETKKIPYYCVEMIQEDGVRKISLFGLKQRKKMLEFVNTKLLDKFIVSLKISKHEK